MSAVVAFIALTGIYVQVSLTRENALRASARQVYLSYSLVTLKNPRLASPNYIQLRSDPDPTELIRYQIYVANMLTVYDEILQINKDPEWFAAFEYTTSSSTCPICAGKPTQRTSRHSQSSPAS
jgi:hypothetical protein